MNNLETVVRERNKAYFDLEVGEIGERPGQLVTNLLGKFNSLITKYICNINVLYNIMYYTYSPC